jgi:hypothetical protein
LIEFSTFVVNFDKKANAVDELFKNLDGIIKEENLAKLSLTKEEAETLKEVREKMLGGIVFTAVTMQNNDRLNMVLGSKILNLHLLNLTFNNNFLGSFISSNAKENLGYHSNVKLDNAMQAIYPGAKEKLGLVNNKQLNSIFLNKEQLSGTELESNVIGNYASAFNNQQLGIHFNKEALGIVLRDKQYVFSQEQLGYLAKDQLGAIVGPLAKDNLGRIFFSTEGLQAFSNSAGTFNAFRLGNTEALRGW